MAVLDSINQQLEQLRHGMSEQQSLDAFDRQVMETRIQDYMCATIASNLEPMINEMTALRESVAEIHGRTVGIEMITPQLQDARAPIESRFLEPEDTLATAPTPTDAR